MCLGMPGYAEVLYIIMTITLIYALLSRLGLRDFMIIPYGPRTMVWYVIMKYGADLYHRVPIDYSMVLQLA